MGVFRSRAHPVWTDRRAGVPGGKEQVFTAAVRDVVNLLPPDIDRCTRYPWLCPGPEMLEGLLVLECPFRGCLIIDPIPKNCLVKFGCPGCTAGALCPPYYHFFLEGLDDNWNVGIFDLYGDPAPFERIATGDGLVLSFRPRKDLYIDGQVGDYFLAFQPGEKGKPGVPLKVKMRLKVSDSHFTTTSDGTR
jgi:hypothetical protein